MVTIHISIHSSILGPFLYAIFVSPLFDLENFQTTYADDNFTVRWNSVIEALILDMIRSLEEITKWLCDLGLKVNESKTEMYLFHQKDCHNETVTINGIDVTSTP